MTTTTQDLLDQVNQYLTKKYRNPPVVISDPLIGGIVKHGNWKYVTQSLTEAMHVACTWGRRERPKWEPLPKDSLLTLCTDFLMRLDGIKTQGATKGEVSSALRFINNQIQPQMAGSAPLPMSVNQQ